MEQRLLFYMPSIRTCSRTVLLLSVGLIATACSKGSEPCSGAACFTDAGTSGTDAGSISAPDAFTPDSGPPIRHCTPACAMGDTCIDGVCCAAERVCGDTCCGGSTVCSFGRCVTPGGECQGSSDCDETEFCDFFVPNSGSDVCVGSTTAMGRCLPRPMPCSAGGRPGESCLDRCEYVPTTFSFEPVVKFHWPDPYPESPAGPTFPYDIQSTPIVVQLDDDNCDHRVDSLDLPDIVVVTFTGAWSGTGGVLHALTARGGHLEQKWEYTGVMAATGQIAGGEIVASSPGNEVVACGSDGRLIALSGAGSLLWRSTMPVCGVAFGTVDQGANPAIGDLDQDGQPEVVVEGGIVDGATGMVRAMLPIRGSFALADLDADGKLDIVGGKQAFRADGSVLAGPPAAIPDPETHWIQSAVVDLDGDGLPEVATVLGGSRSFALWRFNGGMPGHIEMIRAPFQAVVPGARDPGMGPITAGDFDGDGHPDVGFAAGAGYLVLSGAKLMDLARPATLTPEGVLLWMKTTAEDNGSTGSAVFDFNGDGRVEVVYNGIDRLNIFDGRTGDTLASLCNTTASWHEYPVVADVDGDGEADLLIVANSFVIPVARDYYSCDVDGTGPGTERSWQSGLRVLSSRDRSWVRAPRIWNQHSYHVTNVDEDGRIPTVERANWTVAGLNNFRQNRQPGADYAAPDAMVTLRCASMTKVGVTVRNVGEAVLQSGVEVEVLDGAGIIIATGHTTRSLATAQSQTLEIEVGTAAAAADSTRVRIRAGAVPRDCNTSNDEAGNSCVI